MAAVGLAAGLTTVGVLVDLLRSGRLGTVFAVCYLTGCVLAVAWVRRRSLFGPMVQPPLLVAVIVPLVVLLTGDAKPGAGAAERLLVIAAPLVNAFPMMAATTGLVLAVGAFRAATQRPLDSPGSAVSGPRPPSSASGAAARGEARTSGSPPPS